MGAKPFYKSKTLWFNLLILIIGVLTLITQNIALRPGVAAWMTVGIGAANIGLRMITGQPIQSRLNNEELAADDYEAAILDFFHDEG